MEPWKIIEGDGPVIAVALHDGHFVRDEIAAEVVLSEPDRLREEDPFTGLWTSIAPTQIIAQRSRFEVDLNRPHEKCVYQTPADAWGLTVWQRPLPADVLDRSRTIHTEFYSTVRSLLSQKLHEYPKLVIYELHTYNHHRLGPDQPFDDPQANPQVNLGTTYNHPMWRPVLDRFMSDLRAFDFPGEPLDVRENIKFHGGHFAEWVGENFPTTVCNLCIEFKKFFMDEWTGTFDPLLHSAILKALENSVLGVLAELDRL